MKRFCLSLLLVILVWCGWNFPSTLHAEAIPAGSTTTASPQIVERLEKIKTAMGKMRFCFNDDCLYRNLTSTISPPTQPDGIYTATISARIERPSANPDAADYHFAYIDDRWRLVTGEELTDVAEFTFVGDRYEIYSVHTNRTFRGTLAQARIDENLRVGYLPLYYEVLDNGVEKLDPS